ncbi:orotidine-5'-phosphate decarboxylase [Pseudoclavibacter sp. RFBJ3]|uniref:orotidine-5'-phosphate decarboxylase n=1 Tax=unclassified Pseudoclavibacter TaxID=2615177 RepID=UPI000CE8E48C|nr:MULTISPECIES: orotidine-5'-phosphate decarboxylase [unclassified Pseudoclavibacter]MBF4549091.1 orotidine-5'-phosphate decarboxylase [Pseudoclavibacter sp. VKM Ac-2888]PPF76464.1 orotidine-5'-phosphate decarboxylase [Pseudoclavibacter sp. Z016]PPF85058.1 orotidine-5'-phosphate decarboxylase [Pseudoclavibacter sp. RFBJ5]PPF94061.1 orotidine-5'-phosphate decarboxylase [Pseudoclavibacter sp. RFBJ3]PPF98778.1 orotidine-5'-phosphate decarboxylase [Pseudoclavibacter sp. RFBH5]
MASRAGVGGFGPRLQHAVEERGRLCVGIDPHEFLLASWGLPDTATGAEEFGLRVVEAAAGRVGVVKPQIAFFERFGSAGFSALESVLAAARDAGLLVIADVKRGDVGTTLEAYAKAWLEAGSPLEADAMTVNPYQGFDSLAAALELAERLGKGLFVLAATSNPESTSIQTARRDRGTQRGETVAGGIANRAVAWNAQHASGDLGSVGVVLGGTVDFDTLGVDLPALGGAPRTPILAPGFGHQGAEFAQIRSTFGAATESLIVNVSRSVLAAGPDGIAGAIDQQTAELENALS